MKLFRGLILLGLCLAVLGCGPSVRRVETEAAIDISGRWNDTDSRLVSEEMIRDSLVSPWLARFRQTHGDRNPVVIVGTVRNLSHEHIDVRTFVKDLERNLTNSGQVTFVASAEERGELREERRDQAMYSTEETARALARETGADFMLKGTIASIMDRAGGEELKFYQVNLELIDIESNTKAWIGDKKIKKVVRRSRYRP